MQKDFLARRRLFLGSPGQRRIKLFRRHLRKFMERFQRGVVQRRTVLTLRQLFGTFKQLLSTKPKIFVLNFQNGGRSTATTKHFSFEETKHNL